MRFSYREWNYWKTVYLQFLLAVVVAVQKLWPISPPNWFIWIFWFFFLQQPIVACKLNCRFSMIHIISPVSSNWRWDQKNSFINKILTKQNHLQKKCQNNKEPNIVMEFMYIMLMKVVCFTLVGMWSKSKLFMHFHTNTLYFDQKSKNAEG